MRLALLVNLANSDGFDFIRLCPFFATAGFVFIVFKIDRSIDRNRKETIELISVNNTL